MTYIYPLLALASLIVTGCAYLIAPVLACYLTNDGYLKYGKSIFNPTDNTATGDQKWHDEHIGWSDYWLAVTYLWRNPAQSFLQVQIPDNTPFKVRGNPNIKDGIGGIGGWSLVTTDRYFHFTLIYELKWWLPYFSLGLIGIAFALFQVPSLVFMAEIINWAGLILTSIALYSIIVDIREGVGICARSEFGWRLWSLVGGYQHKTRGQIVVTPLRFYKFTKG